ncbi:DUF2809 domain-containing protein [Pelagicoccus sp. SDUM812005]|uniref:ribosomal maturation YjgA family protein n=1 Tax=Pelagicoccus sp. SDUM812005 TaxID=3041257 RepID=UPI00281015DD|nr:DUF2809 domain-containing protein [Pelagicoccus sp. SDUM812005]MDQ8182674.1 DUF2809 domain-containing protein [Pelagicoccus sp. SDUM812005]
MNPDSSTKPLPRARLVLLAALTIAIGLLSRRFPIAGNYPGDALWATLVYFLWAILLPHRPYRLHFFLAATTAACVEFSQLYHAPWIDSFRQTLAGRLALGSGFDPYDLLAYAIGCVLGLICVHRLAPK